MDELSSTETKESDNSRVPPLPTWYDSWNDLGGVDNDAPQPSITDEASTPFSPISGPPSFCSTNTSILSPHSSTDCSSPDPQSLDPQWPLSSYPLSPSPHDVGFPPFPGQPIHHTIPLPLYDDDPNTVTWAATACSVAQSWLPPPTWSGSSFSSSPPNRAAQPFNPAVPNFNTVTHDVTWGVDVNNHYIMDPSPSKPAQGSTNSSPSTPDPKQPPAKNRRTRNSPTGKANPRSAKSKKMSFPQQTTTPPKGESSDVPAEAQPPPLQSPQSPEDQQARLRDWHNCIGKRYRSKLNEQFESLQAVLIPESTDGGGKSSGAEDADEDVEVKKEPRGEGEGEGESGGKRKGLNKAKLLDMARERIERLTREREELEREERELVEGLRVKGVNYEKGGGGE
ncbi:hypothetical protein QBC34DRAFT_455498 [Podospora aff. communis PSN243]|uniref:BHLH domain-containing protein n=1 Tax=Podospora aff. communis PSN243 TaxID=3040156 RepID=A0AAV9GVD0_9PEZI|nr:hypothetical protein QBC34DRAFT_455498 [Podospora aff. communis PSN243]